MSRVALAQQIKSENYHPQANSFLQRKCTSCGSKSVVEEECSDCSKKTSSIQRKLSIGASNDPLEHEADRVADQVMSMRPTSGVAHIYPRIQRVSNQSSSDGGSAPASVDRVLASSGNPMKAALRQDMEQRFGQDFSNVRIHTGSAAEQSARDISARAYTAGNNVIFGTGQFAPDSNSGKRLLAHELTHVVQQEHGNSSSSVQRFLTCEAEENCPSREPGEVARSRRNPMTLAPITSGGVGMVISNFAVAEGQIRGDLTSNSDWNVFISEAQENTNVEWGILGFSDCEGEEVNNARLRTARATSLYLNLPVDVQARVSSFEGASLDQCIRSNSSEAERALNRSALIWVQSTTVDEDEFEPTRVVGDNSRLVYMCSKPLDTSPIGTHAFFRLDSPSSGNDTISLQPILVNSTCDCWQGIPNWNYASDVSAAGSCTLTSFTFSDLYREFQAYPIGHYCTLGPNSNTFVGHIARNLGMTNPDPDGITPGIDDSPPPAGTFAPDKWVTLTGCVTKECLCPPDAEADVPSDTEIV